MIFPREVFKFLLLIILRAKLSSCYLLCSWRDTTVGDHTKIDNLVQVS